MKGASGFNRAGKRGLVRQDNAAPITRRTALAISGTIHLVNGSTINIVEESAMEKFISLIDVLMYEAGLRDGLLKARSAVAKIDAGRRYGKAIKVEALLAIDALIEKEKK